MHFSGYILAERVLPSLSKIKAHRYLTQTDDRSVLRLPWAEEGMGGGNKQRTYRNDDIGDRRQDHNDHEQPRRRLLELLNILRTKSNDHERDTGDDAPEQQD